MLRSILRNVQYYLLFFSILLVLLAFQRLQWYDQGLIPNPYAFIDRPVHGRGFSSPDNAGRVYYGGYESKEIGLFKFRLGLFNFALPTFSKDGASWERSMTVPPPPSNRRKSTEKLLLRLKAQSRLRSHSESSEELREDGTSNFSVAYVVVITRLQRLTTFRRPSKTKNIKEWDASPQNFLHNRPKVLSQSIVRAHENSPYEYQLYALNFNVRSNDGDWGHEALVQSGFKIMNVSDGELSHIDGQITLQSYRNLKIADEQQNSFLKLLSQHDVIVQMNLDSFVLKPMNDLFDVLAQGGDINRAIGVVGVERGLGGEEMPGKQVKRVETNSTQVDLFVLDPLTTATTTSAIVQNELLIVRPSSHQAINAYLKRLQCMSGNLFPTKQSHRKKPRFYPKLRPPSLTQNSREINSHSKQSSWNQEQCNILTENSLRLDRCFYDAGNLNIGHNCSHVSFENDVRVYHFLEGAGVAEKSKAEGEAEQSGEAGQNGQSRCLNPWDASSEKDCSKGDEKHGEEEVCTWLCSEWFGLVK